MELQVFCDVTPWKLVNNYDVSKDRVTLIFSVTRSRSWNSLPFSDPEYKHVTIFRNVTTRHGVTLKTTSIFSHVTARNSNDASTLNILRHPQNFAPPLFLNKKPFVTIWSSLLEGWHISCRQQYSY